MAREIKYYIVAANALPEIFVKVAEAKRMMQTGEADTVGAATKQVGISRSAFYKYKDAVQPFNDMKAEHIITFYCMLKDNTGVLSSVLSVFATSGANILPINQGMPTNGCAAVTISAETSGLAETLEKLRADVAVLAGERERNRTNDTDCDYGPWYGGHRRGQGSGGKRPADRAKAGRAPAGEDHSGAAFQGRALPSADDG